MTKKLASIVIPVYNVEPFLEACIKSIADNSKDYEDKIEIILVDDGSPDNCPELCDKLQSEYNNVKAFHKENGGLSDARNFGVEKASGKYLIFIDSDDTVNENFSKVLQFISEFDYDFIECGCKVIDGEKTDLWTNTEFKGTCITSSDKAQILASKMLPMATTKVVNKEFFIKNNLYFRTGFIHEDEHYMPRLLLSAESIYITNEFCWYNYLIRNGSITTNYTPRNALHLLDNMKDLEEEILPNLKDEKLLKAFKTHLTRVSLGVLLKGKLVKKEAKEEYYEILKRYNFLYEKGYNLKQKLVILIIKIFGLKTAVKLINFIK